MKKCLITGAAGQIGIKQLNELIKSQKYEITAVDLKSNKSLKRFANYETKVNIVYADVNDKSIIKQLIKDHDIIFHLAGIIPYVADVNSNLMNIVDYQGTVSIVDIIKKCNPKATLIFPSTTALYGDTKNVDNKSEINIYNNDFYSQNKYKLEQYIKKNLDNYIIYRIPMIISKDNFDNMMYNVLKNKNVEVISDELVGIALLKTLKHLKKLNGKTFILSGGSKYRTTTNKLIRNVLKINGISFRYMIMSTFMPQNFYTHYYDTEDLNKILDYQKGSIKEIYKSWNELKKFKRCLNRLLAYYSIRKLSKQK